MIGTQINKQQKTGVGTDHDGHGVEKVQATKTVLSLRRLRNLAFTATTTNSEETCKQKHSSVIC